MASGPMYILMDSHQRHPHTNKPVQAYVIDRTPQGPLADYVEVQDKGCTPCGLKGGDPGVPDRMVIRLPENVKRAYRSSIYAHFVNRYTLPGFLTWCSENGYDTVDMKHVMPTEFGIWIQYSDSSEDEFRAARGGGVRVARVARDAPAMAPKKKNLNRAGIQSGKEAKAVALRVAKPGARKVAAKVGARRLLRR